MEKEIFTRKERILRFIRNLFEPKITEKQAIFMSNNAAELTKADCADELEEYLNTRIGSISRPVKSKGRITGLMLVDCIDMLELIEKWRNNE